MDAPVLAELDPCDPNRELVSMFTNVDELNDNAELFTDPDRSPAENTGPFVTVVDNFYRNPRTVRQLALQMELKQYSPPIAEIHGAVAAAEFGGSPVWWASAIVTYFGLRVENEFHGERYNPAWLRRRLSDLLEEEVAEDTWETCGDYWNGAFHFMNEKWTNGLGWIHHHYRSIDLEGRGWSGVVYLSENPPERSGTSIWRRRDTGRCVAPYGRSFSSDVKDYELVHFVENRFNRLVLVREAVLHRAERGFGTSFEDSRLTQTLFMRTSR